MKKLNDYEILKQKVFYRGWNILEYIEHKELSKLDIEAIKATIMDALVSCNFIDPVSEYLDFEKLCITSIKTESVYEFERYPNICGIPLWMKQLFRTKCCQITGGIPVSIFLVYPSKNRCIYDMNTAVSALFDDCTFYRVNYNSLTRPGTRALQRPFVEITVDGIAYLVDNLTRRIIRRDFFEKNYGFDVEDSFTKQSLQGDRKKYYEEEVCDYNNFATYVLFYSDFYGDSDMNYAYAEYSYELEESKKYFGHAWEEYEVEKIEKEFYEKFQKVKTDRK